MERGRIEQNLLPFKEQFKNLNKISIIISIFGHIASMFLAYYFISQSIDYVLGNSDNIFVIILSFIITLIILVLLEVIKRELFNLLVGQYLKYKSIIHKSVIFILLSSFISFSISFLATINGAKEFSSKSNEIEMIYEDNADKMKNDIIEKYQVDISRINSEIERNNEFSWKKKEEQDSYDSNTFNGKRKINQIREDIKLAEDKNKELLTIRTEIENNRDNEINEVLNKNSDKASKEISTNDKNTLTFVIFSCIIELLIVVGVGFNRYYTFSVKIDEETEKRTSPNYKMWEYHTKILDSIMNDDTKINDKLPSIANIVELGKINDIILLPKDVTESLKLYSQLGIIRNSGSSKYYSKTFREVNEILTKHFKIK